MPLQWRRETLWYFLPSAALAYYRSAFERKDTKAVHEHNLQGHPHNPCPAPAHIQSAAWLQNWTKRLKKEKTNEARGGHKYLKNWQSFCWTSGSAGGLPAKTAAALSSYRIFETLSVFKRLLSDKVACVHGRVGPKKSPRALMACSTCAKASIDKVGKGRW